MDRYEGPHTAISIVLHRGLYLADKMDRYGGPLSSLTMVMLRGLYLAIIIYR
jgi:hypothetical protein